MFCLKVPTDSAWAKSALLDLDAVLVDHAHCELKAASNATSLLGRYPGLPQFSRALSELAREELEHFEQVLRFLDERGIALPPPEIDVYAKELRQSIAKLPAAGQYGLVDRLLASAIIEARSCERFKLLVEALEKEPECDAELLRFYRELFECEARHYTVYTDLASTAAGSREIALERLHRLAAFEGEIVERLRLAENRATVHG